jgi:anti-sigma B factor antagonist
MDNTQLLVMTAEGEAQVRVLGRATLGRSRCLREFALGMINTGTTRFVIDLGECVAMDSTFAGTLALIALRARTRSGTVDLVNANARVDSVLTSLGLKKLFTHAQGVATSRQGVILPKVSDDGTGRTPSLRQTILDAHETLAEVDKANVPKFQDIIAFIKAEDEESGRPTGSVPRCGEPLP